MSNQNSRQGRQAAPGAAPHPAEEAIRVPPHNDEAERSVLGCAMIVSSLVGLIEAYMRPEDFYRESHRIIWRSMLSLYKREQIVDVITLADELNNCDQLDAVGGPKFLLSLTLDVPNVAAIEYYLRICSEYAAQRRTIAKARALVDALYDGKVRGEEIAAALGKMALECAPSAPAGAGVEGAAAIREWNTWVYESLQPNGTALSTGIEELDGILDGGLRFGRSYYVGGLSKMGKTTFAIWCMARALDAGWAVDMLSVEMARPELVDRLIACMSGLDMRRYKNALKIRFDLERGQLYRKLTRDDEMDLAAFEGWHEKVDAVRQKISASLLRVDRQASPIARDLHLSIQSRRLQLEARGHDPRKLLVVADYLQSFRTGHAKLDADDTQKIANVSQRLNGISKEFDCPIIIPFQFGREAERAFESSGKTPTFADARGSSQIANDANHLLVYHRPFFRDMEQKGRYVRITSELSRTQQGTPTIHLEVDGPRQRYATWQQDVPSDEEIERLAKGATKTQGRSRAPERSERW